MNLIKILISTSTLAWGVNFPARTVIIKGTKYFNEEIGSYADLNYMNIMQMFGRAGRSNEIDRCKGILITNNPADFYYNQTIESHLLSNICNLLLAEICIGLCSFVDAVEWFKHTYFYVRLNTYSRGVSKTSHNIIYSALVYLENKGMIEDLKTFNVTHLGKIAVKNYIDFKEAKNIYDVICNNMSDGYIIDLIGGVDVFKNIRKDVSITTPIPVKTIFGKYFQMYIGRIEVQNDEMRNYLRLIENNSPRILNALFEMSMAKKSYSTMKIFEYMKAINNKQFPNQTPLRHFINEEKRTLEIESKAIPFNILRKFSEDEFDKMGITG